MSEHTPGPWAIEEDHDDMDGTVMIHGAADAPGLVPVALVYTADAFPCIEDEDREAADTMCKADARLIAAAPDLFHELQWTASALASLVKAGKIGEHAVITIDGVRESIGEILDAADRALGKAKGDVE